MNRQSPIQHFAFGITRFPPVSTSYKMWHKGLNTLTAWSLVFLDYDSFSTQHAKHFEARISRKKILYDTTPTLPANTLPITKTDRRKPVQWTSVSRNSVSPNNNNLQNSISWCLRQHNTIGMTELAHSSYYTGFREIHYLWRHQLSIFRNPVANKQLFPLHSGPNLRLS